MANGNGSDGVRGCGGRMAGSVVVDVVVFVGVCISFVVVNVIGVVVVFVVVHLVVVVVAPSSVVIVTKFIEIAFVCAV